VKRSIARMRRHLLVSLVFVCVVYFSFDWKTLTYRRVYLLLFLSVDAQGMGNIFAVEPKQLYTESPTSDKYAKVGLGGIPGAILAMGILAGVFFGVKTLGSFEEVNNEFAGYDGESVSYYSDKFSA